MWAAVVRFAPSKERAMLKPTYASLLRKQDLQVFDALVPTNHYLRQELTVVDFELSGDDGCPYDSLVGCIYP